MNVAALIFMVGGFFMKRIAALTAGILLVGLTAGVSPALAVANANEPPVLKTRKDIQSYAIGVQTMRNTGQFGIELEPDIVARGMRDTISGKLLMPEDAVKEAIDSINSQMTLKQREGRIALAFKNKKEGEKFLAQNKTQEGVISLPDGLQYKVFQAGNGRKPATSDTVECKLRGTLLNGTELFSKSDGMGQTATIDLSDTRVIAGLKEALKLMPVGSTWQVFIPSKLAYLEQGWGSYVGPNETLIYEIKLVGIK